MPANNEGGKTMGLRLLIIVVFAGFLTGCATTQQPNALSQLQIKVAQLEHKVEDRDQEISDLKYEIQNLSNQTQKSESETPMVIPMDKNDSVDVVSDSSSETKDEGIIRVDASAQQVQKALKNAGYYNGNVDGKMGPNTQKAIEKFQKDHNLKSDGIIGKKTWQELKTYLSNS